MKKIDAIDKLQNILIDELRIDSLYYSEETCKNVLNRIEKEIGMLPPKHPTKRVNEISLLRPAYMWEDEDDKRD